jgi:anaerobic selenocysteine-containing dehydrogenase
MGTTHSSTCPYDCPDACGLLAEVEDGRVVAVRGNAEHGYSRGSLCPKMVHYERTVNHPDRLLHPLIRTGPKGAGQFRRASWEEALALVAARLRAMARAHGGQAILPYSYAGTMGVVQKNAGHALFHALGASRLARTICSPAKSAGIEAILGATPGPDPEAALDASLIVLWGTNTVATNLHFLGIVKEARRRGAQVWLIDTHQTATSAVVDRTIVVRPGSDGALALGLCHLLAREGLAATRFLAEEAVGWEALEAQVLPDHAPAATAARTGVDEATLLELARALGQARAPFLRLGEGLSRYGNGAMNVRSIFCLAAVAGCYAKPGAGCLGDTSSGAAFDAAPLQRPDLQPGPTRLVNMNRLGHALEALGDPRVMALFVYSTNPAAVAPDQNAVLRGLAREDLFTVVHERFLTDTARYADVLLPATTSLEHADLYRSYGQYFIQRARPAVAPPGECRSNWELFRALAAALGLDGEPWCWSADQVIDRLLDAPSPWREGLDRAALEAGRPVRLRVPPGPRWRTPSGKVEILNPRHAEPLPRWLPSHADAEDGAEGTLPLRLQTTPALYALNSTFMDRDDLAEKRGPLRVCLSPGEAAARGLGDGDRAVAWNALGEVALRVEVSAGVPDGLAVVAGVHWARDTEGGRNINALTSQRLTDEAGGSTFYDNRIDVRRA